jgi:hypothetical protein
MGNYQSSVTRQFISSVNNIINQSATAVYNQASQQCSAINVLNANFGAAPSGQTCPVSVTNSRINFRQNASTTCNLTSLNRADLNTQFTNEVQQRLQQLANADIKNKQGFLSTAVSIQENNLTSEQQLINAITNTISQNVTNLCTSVSQASNQGNLIFCGIYQDTTIDVAQNATIQAMVSCVNEALAKTQVGNTTIADIIQRTDAKLASQQEGIGSVLWIILLIIGGVLVLGIIGFVIFMLLQPKGGGSTQVITPPLSIPGVPTSLTGLVSH